MVTVRVSSKGQIAIPKGVRAELGLQEGMELSLEIQGQNLVMRKVASRSWQKWRGLLKGTQALQEHQQEHQQEVASDEKNRGKRKPMQRVSWLT